MFFQPSILSDSTQDSSISLPSEPSISEEPGGVEEFGARETTVTRPASSSQTVSIHDFTFIKVLGKGSFGKVNNTLVKRTKQKLAGKQT